MLPDPAGRCVPTESAVPLPRFDLALPLPPLSCLPIRLCAILGGVLFSLILKDENGIVILATLSLFPPNIIVEHPSVAPLHFSETKLFTEIRTV